MTCFGEAREFLTGTLQIALRCRSPIVQGFVVSRRNFYFRLIVKPLYMPPAGEGDAAEDPKLIAALMQQYADGIESHLREHPDHVSGY